MVDLFGIVQQQRRLEKINKLYGMYFGIEKYN